MDGEFPSYLSICDLSPNNTMLYCSPSIKDNIGFDQAELIGKSSWALVHPDETEAVRKITMRNLTGHEVASLLHIRIRHKDCKEGEDGWVRMDVLVNVCYDCFVIIATRSSSTSKRNFAWKSSAGDDLTVTDDGQLISHKWNNQIDRFAFAETFSWDAALPQREPRTFLLVNRFTRACNVLFASTCSNEVLEVDHQVLVGKSFIDYVSPECRALITHQINYVKETQHIGRIDFQWIPFVDKRINLQAVITLAYDALVFIIRRNH